MSSVKQDGLSVAEKEVAGQPHPEKKVLRIRYWRAFLFFFSSSRWFSNLLWLTTLLAVPVIGKLVIVGYLYELIESLFTHPKRKYPNFAVKRLSEYLYRGLWPYSLGMIMNLTVLGSVSLLLLGILSLTQVLVTSMGDSNSASLAGIAVGSMLILILAMCLLLYGLMLMPLLLRVGLSQNFFEGLKFAWAWDFVRRTWYDLIFTLSVLSSLILPVIILLALSIAVGVIYFQTPQGLILPILFVLIMIPAANYATLVHSHLTYQLYDLYLSRGGDPIPLKSSIE